jgi:ABC-2 type transport system ATP-binding protein
MQGNIIVEARNVTKSYGKMLALDQVSFRLEEGKIYGLLGRNGAGKTTLMNILTAQWFATSGEVRLFGEDPYENDRVLRRVCFIKESQIYPKSLRVKDVFELSASFFPNWDRAYADALAREFGLPQDRRMGKLSRGMLSTVGIIVGLASRAELTIFDEPYLGLDAVARGLFYDRLLADYAEHPRTIVLSTHLIDEVSRLLSHVLMIDRGRLVADADADALRSSAFTVEGLAGEVDAFTAGCRVMHRETIGGTARVVVRGALDAEAKRQAERRGLAVGPVSLQELFIRMTGWTEQERKEASGQ